VEYRAAPATCNACPVKVQCTPSAHGRLVHRHFAEAYLDRVRVYHQGEPYAKAMRKRKAWVEPLFAEGKQWHGMRRFRLRSLWRVNTEALLIATGQNLKRLLQQRGWGRRPFPNGAAAGGDCLWVLRRVLVAAADAGLLGTAVRSTRTTQVPK
jgi:Transposase DDE domain